MIWQNILYNVQFKDAHGNDLIAPIVCNGVSPYEKDIYMYITGDQPDISMFEENQALYVDLHISHTIGSRCVHKFKDCVLVDANYNGWETLLTWEFKELWSEINPPAELGDEITLSYSRQKPVKDNSDFWQSNGF